MVLSPSVAASGPTRDERRSARLDARYALWQLSSLQRVRACGRYVSDKDAGVYVKVSGSVATGDRVAGLSGVQSCGSVWACPVCAEKIQAERQSQVATAMAVARLRGWEVLFLTLTMRHARDHKLKYLWEQLSAAWRATTSGSRSAWKSDRQAYGIQGYIRLVEVTHGEANGWHVHVHTLLFVDPAKATEVNVLGEVVDGDQLALGGSVLAAVRPLMLTDAAVQSLGTSMFLRWRDGLAGTRIKPSMRRGVDIKRVRSDESIAEYFAKGIYSRKGEGSTAHDVTGSHGKAGKHGNRTPFGILASLVDVSTGEVSASFERDVELWQTFEAASKGRRQLLWSQGLKGLLLPDDPDKTDQEIVDEAPGGETVDWLSPAEYAHVCRRRLLAAMLQAAESDDDGVTLCAFLNTLRVRVATFGQDPPQRC